MRSIVVGTAGHIDHGKSALVQALTGTDPDRLKEEKARGITIDLGFAHATIGGMAVAFVDVPGHERFVKNMLAGVGGIDLVVLVVAADESVMPQTREHFEICRLLRVPAGFVALTKSDLADAETLEVARLEVRELVAGSFLEPAPVVAVSARTGAGLDAFRAALVQASAKVEHHAIGRATRLPIDRVFSMKGFGTVVTGTLVSGGIAADDELALLPGRRAVKVRGVQVHGRPTGRATAGQRSAVNLAGVEVGEIARGLSLVTPGAFVETRVADAAVEVLPGAKPLKHGARIRFHQGTAEIIGRIGVIDPARTVIEPGARGFVRLRLEAAAVLSRGDRYILRAYSPPLTIAGGVVLDPLPPRDRIRTVAATERSRAMMVGSSDAEQPGADRRAAIALAAAAGATGLPEEALASRLGMDSDARDALVASLVNARAVVVAGALLVDAAVLERLQESIVAALAAHHRAEPLSEGVPRDELRDKLNLGGFRRGHHSVFERALTELVQAGRIVVKDRVALSSHRLALSPEEARVRDAVDAALRAAGLTPPDVGGLAASLSVAAPVVDRVVKLLMRQKRVVRLDTLLFHEEALQKLKTDVASLKALPTARIDVAGFKERFGVTRKFAIPLLEYLDRERVTRRTGDSRVVL
ncbi:MAG TPA: selenocysteine-specific translation elongation factor [Vicinamibacterales bacterium]|nr:selenocysteine-specific translation elongation factor [Vicinamibacterales bacterium]